MLDISDSYTLHVPRERVWDALIDPDTLKRVVPGCESLKRTGANAYTVRLNVGVAGTKEVYDGTLHLLDVREPETCRMVVEGAGSAGVLRSDTALRLEARDEDTTVVHCSGRAHLDTTTADAGTGAPEDTANMLIRQYFDQLADALPGTSSAIAAITTITAPDAPMETVPLPSPAPPATVAAEEPPTSAPDAPERAAPKSSQSSRPRQKASRSRKPKNQPVAQDEADVTGQQEEQGVDAVSGPVAQTTSRKSGRSSTSRQRGRSTSRKNSTPEPVATNQEVENRATVEAAMPPEIAETREIAVAPDARTIADAETVPSGQSPDLTTPSEVERVEHADRAEVARVELPPADELVPPEVENASLSAHLDVLSPTLQVAPDVAMPAFSDGTQRIAQVTFEGRRALGGESIESGQRVATILGVLIAIITVVLAALLVWFVVGGVH